jgi:hypothetical protein
MSDEEKKRIFAPRPSRYASYVACKFRQEISSLGSCEVELTPLLPHEGPTEFRTEKTERSLGSMIKLNDRLLAVDETLKSLIEGLDPSVHQFWPMRITSPKGVNDPNPYYGMLVHRYLESFRPEVSLHSAWEKDSHRDVYRTIGSEKATCAMLAMSEAIIGGSHIWCERHLERPRLFMSDTLQASIKDAGLRVWRHYKMKSI